MTEQLFFFLVNPAAGAGRAAALWPAVRQEATRRGLRYTFEMTRGSLTGASFVRQALREGAATIVAVGGDGTLNEVVNGLFLDGEPLGADAEVALIPAGSGSDVARTLGIPPGLDALSLLREAATPLLDVGRLTFGDVSIHPAVRHFLNNADVGVGAEIAERAVRLKGLGGRVAFALAAARTVFAPRPWQGLVSIDGGPPEAVRALSLVVANGPFTGGGMHVAPGAGMDDGVLDVVLIEEMGALELLANLPSVYRGMHLSHPRVRHLQAREVRVDTTESPRIEVDGEVAGAGSATFSILPGALRMRVPRRIE